MAEIVDLPLYAPIPVGHRISLVPLELLVTPLFGGPSRWEAMNIPLVCDEVTRIIYTDRSVGLHPETTYAQIRFKNESVRISQTQPPFRGVVASCLALYDSGDTVHMHTILHVVPEATVSTS